ncbi:MAG: hypothetical protein FWF52_01200 [Candidatus Azobacteroides sp.]|nr:hypothetical protein [Candidatus Azobacteroides sp.]
MIDTQTILKEELEQLRVDVVDRQKEVGAWASGNTAAGYETAVESGYHGWMGGYSYVEVLEVGRRPGKVPVYFKEIIKRWIIAKGLQYQSERELNRMAASIAWVIRKEGSYLHRHGYRIDIFAEPLERFYNRLNLRLMTYYALQITETIAWQ